MAIHTFIHQLSSKNRALLLASFALVALLGAGTAFCQQRQSGPLTATQIQARLNQAGYAPLWQIEWGVSSYTVEGIDPSGNPVILEVDPFSADIVTLQSLALLH